MIDCTQYTLLLVTEFNKTPGTSSVEVRCSIAANELEVGILDQIKQQIDELLFEDALVVDRILFAEQSEDPNAKDFFIRITKV